MVGVDFVLATITFKICTAVVRDKFATNAYGRTS